MNLIPQFLRDYFADRASVSAPEPLLIHSSRVTAHTTNRIREWLDKVISGIEDAAAKYKSENDSSKHIYAYCIGVGSDFRNMDQSDWAALLPELHDLHEVCRENNIRLDLEGFDSLPRPGFVTANQIDIHPYKIEVRITCGEPYHLKCNPFSEGQIRKGLGRVVDEPIPSRLRPDRPLATMHLQAPAAFTIMPPP